MNYVYHRNSTLWIYISFSNYCPRPLTLLILVRYCVLHFRFWAHLIPILIKCFSYASDFIHTNSLLSRYHSPLENILKCWSKDHIHFVLPYCSSPFYHHSNICIFRFLVLNMSAFSQIIKQNSLIVWALLTSIILWLFFFAHLQNPVIYRCRTSSNTCSAQIKMLGYTPAIHSSAGLGSGFWVLRFTYVSYLRMFLLLSPVFRLPISLANLSRDSYDSAAP